MVRKLFVLKLNGNFYSSPSPVAHWSRRLCLASVVLSGQESLSLWAGLVNGGLNLTLGLAKITAAVASLRKRIWLL